MAVEEVSGGRRKQGRPEGRHDKQANRPGARPGLAWGPATPQSRPAWGPATPQTRPACSPAWAGLGAGQTAAPPSSFFAAFRRPTFFPFCV